MEKLRSKPVFIYNNPVESRNIIKKDLFNKSGIYMWYNNVNGKCYIESGVNLYKIISNYYQNAYLKRSYPIVNAIKKYGLNSFTLIILEIIEKRKDDSNSRLLRLNREDYYLLTYLPEYNILEKGTSSLNYKHTIEAKA
jgi:group I intron endonuclease